MAIICHKREPSQEPRPKAGTTGKMKVTKERKIHEAEEKAGARASHQVKPEYSPSKKEGLLPPTLKPHSNSNADFVTDLGQPLWASIFSTVKWEDSNKRGPTTTITTG